MTRGRLAGADLYDWIALRRVSDGGIARTGDCWVDAGRRLPGYVTDTLAELCEAGLVTLAELDGWEMARATLTDAGATRYEQLCRQRQTAVPPEAVSRRSLGRWIALRLPSSTAALSTLSRAALLSSSGGWVHPDAPNELPGVWRG